MSEVKEAKVDKPKFLLVEEFYDPDDSIAIDWSDLEEEVFDSVPSELLYNISAVESDGSIIERTVVYLYPTKKFKKTDKKFDNGDIIIGIEQ